MRSLIPLFLLGTCMAATFANAQPPAAPARAESPGPLGAEEARAAATELAGMLEENFVYPHIGVRYAAMLRDRVAAGAYDAVSDRIAFTRMLTDELQAVAPDGHLRVELPPPPPSAGDGPNRAPGAPAEAVEVARWLAPGVAYIRFNAFPGDPATVAKARAFIEAHRGARAVIFDIRTHRGGGLGEMDAMLPHLFARPTDLVAMETRANVEREHGAMIPDGPTMRRAPSSDAVVRRIHHVTPVADGGLTDATAFVLTSSVTGSAAEHFALAMKRTGRATLIGEATAGANHFGGLAPIGPGFAAFMPVGRTFDPDTGEGWEGVGVAPDIAVAPEAALVEALTRAGIGRIEAERLSAEVSPTAPMRRERGRPRAVAARSADRATNRAPAQAGARQCFAKASAISRRLSAMP